MAKITRATQKQFGLSGPTADFGQFGSLAAASPVTSKNPATIQALTAFLSGWASAVETIGSQPDVQALEDVNALDFLIFYQLCYLFQAGIPEWDAGTTYYTNSYCQVAGTIYKSLVDTNLNLNPSTNPSSWSNVQSATPAGYLYGLVPSNDTIDPTDGIAFTAGTAKDHLNQYTMNPLAITKKVNSTWAVGNNSGGLDSGTIGVVAVKIYLFAIGKSTDVTAGDFLISKSITPTMTLPNAGGFDIYRLVGQRYWDGSKIAGFRTSGNGPDKTTFIYNTIPLTSTLSGSFTDCDVSPYVDGSVSRIINIGIYAHSNSVSDVSTFTRPKGSSEATGTSTTFGSSHDDQSGPGNPGIGDTGEVVINTSAVFQYATNANGQILISLRGYTESL